MGDDGAMRAPRLSRPDRRRQLLVAAMRIVREEGADRLTLGRLAVGAGVSKPVVYEHFPTRSRLLIELYRWIDTERVEAFRAAMAAHGGIAAETVTELAQAFILCAADQADEFHAVGAALAGSEDKAAVYRELLDNVVEMFKAVLRPCCGLEDAELSRLCVGLVGAGEALSEGVIRGNFTAATAVATFGDLIRRALGLGAQADDPFKPQQKEPLGHDHSGTRTKHRHR